MTFYAPFPLKLGMKAPPPKGFTGFNASADPDFIANMEVEAEAEDINVGGRLMDGFIGIDIDVHDNGFNGFNSLEDIALPSTLAISPHNHPCEGGMTLIYRTPPEFNSNSLRGNNGGVDRVSANLRYTLLPPSVHPNGNVYRYGQSDARFFKELPSEILDDPDFLISDISEGLLKRIFGAREQYQNNPMKDTSACAGLRNIVRIGERMISDNPRRSTVIKATWAAATALGQGHTGGIWALGVLSSAAEREGRESDEVKKAFEGALRKINLPENITVCSLCSRKSKPRRRSSLRRI